MARRIVRHGAAAGLLALAGAAALTAPLASSPRSNQAAPPAGQNGAPASPPPSGRSGGRGNPAAALYIERCAACHGTESAPGRAQSLFDDQWTHAKDDEGIARVISSGVPRTEMMAFKGLLPDDQIWQLVGYLRTQGANQKPRPPYVTDADNQVITSQKQTFRMEVIARQIETPWGLAFLPDGRLIVTERGGRVRIVPKDGGPVVTVTGTPKVWERQDAGMFDVEVHPQYASNGWIYLSYAEPAPGAAAPVAEPAGAAPAGQQPPGLPSMTTVVRGKITRNNEWTDQQFVFRADPSLYTANNTHFGSRFIFDKEGHLFYTIGDRGVIADAQDLSKAAGKVHRVNDDGSAPKDNPLAGRPGALPTIWSYGHRNPQGLAWDPVTGALWESEHGPQGGDEINVIEPGKNYGWGVITMGVQPDITKRAEPGMEQPIVYYTPTIAPSGIAFYTGDRYPGWKNNLFVSALAGQQLRRLEVTGNTVTAQEVLFNQFGRVHDVVQGPDGLLYVTLQLPGQPMSSSTMGSVARLVPVVK